VSEDLNAKWNMQELIAHYGRVIAHGGLQPEKGFGGCNCNFCDELRAQIEEEQRRGAAEFYDEHYPPVGGFL
jgi:hypothetical protein